MDSLIKPYNDRRASFGRHETFSLRYAWLTKGFQAFMKKKTIFSSDEATIELGVGKNMVNAIKYWLRARINVGRKLRGFIKDLVPSLMNKKLQ